MKRFTCFLILSLLLVGCGKVKETKFGNQSIATTSGTGDVRAVIGPKLTDWSPLDAAVGVAVSATLSATFDEEIDGATIHGSTSGTACTGSVQVSKDAFATCVSLTAVTLSTDKKQVSFKAAASLLTSTTYKIQVTKGMAGTNGINIADTAQSSGFTTVAESIPPTVSLTVPVDKSASIEPNTSFSVTFSEAMTASSITANATDTTCSGSIQLSADTFLTCVKFASATATSGSSGKTFSLTTPANLDFSQKYTLKITTAAKDLSGNALAVDKTVAFGVRAGQLVFAEGTGGGGATGINQNTSQSVVNTDPVSAVVFNGKLYAAWAEFNGTVNQIRVKQFDGTTWTSVDGGGVNGVTVFAAATRTEQPKLAVHNSSLYLMLNRVPSSGDMYILRWDGTSSWLLYGGAKLDKISGNVAKDGTLYSSGGVLYASWVETGSFNRVRVATVTSNSRSFIDGTNGISNTTAVSTPSTRPQIIGYNGALHFIWSEKANASETGIYERTYNPTNQSWSNSLATAATTIVLQALVSFTNPAVVESSAGLNIIADTGSVVMSYKLVGGTISASNGGSVLNRLGSHSANSPALALVGTQVYAAWSELNTVAGVLYNIRLAKYDTSADTYTLIDGGLSTGINANTSKNGYKPTLVSYNNQLYIFWIEFGNTLNQVRVKTYK